MLAISDVEEVAHADDLAQRLPGLDVGGVVGAVAWVDLVVDGHGAVGAQAEAEHQLFEVRAVVFAVAAFEFESVRRLATIAAVGLDRCAVIVDTRQVELEQLDDVDDKLRHQRGAVGPVEAVQGAPEAVVVDLVYRQRGLSDGARVNRGNPSG